MGARVDDSEAGVGEEVSGPSGPVRGELTDDEKAARLLARILLLDLDEQDERDACRADPARMIAHMVGSDQRDGSKFTFEHVRDPLEPDEVAVRGNALVPRDKTWRWQRAVIDRLLVEPRMVALKGRQIGVTWVVLAVDVVEALMYPGSVSLLYRQREDEAVDNVRRWWTLYQSLPAYMKTGIKVIKPDLGRAERPGREGIALRFPDGAISEIVPMTSAASSGHGRSVRRVILDEAAHIEKLAQIRAAVEPAAGRAKIVLISTANGRSNVDTGEGNEFHRLWVTADAGGYRRIFLPYDVHPGRDETWYAEAPEVQSLKSYQRQEQFPRDEHEAFALSDRTYFEPEDLIYYRSLVRLPLYRADFVDAADRSKLARGPNARLRKWVEAVDPKEANVPGGMLRVFEEPEPGHRYAVGADPATGRGMDSSVAYVIDLSTQALVAEWRGNRVDEDLFAAQLHYIGRWYGRDVPADPRDPKTQPGFAKLAIESAVGHGAAVIAALRDRTAGRPAYGNLYRHRLDNRSDLAEAKPYGFPMNQQTRPKVLGQLDQAIRERTLPYVTDQLLFEMEDFVEHEHGTTPRARDGSHDDCVLAASIALEMYRQYGFHAAKPRRSSSKKFKHWLPVGARS